MFAIDFCLWVYWLLCLISLLWFVCIAGFCIVGSLYVRWFSGVFALLVSWGVLGLLDLVVVATCLVWYDCVSY